MASVILTVGCPGAGKTTYAKDLARGGWVNLCLDDFRTALFGSKQFYHDHNAKWPSMRKLLHDAYDAAVRAALDLDFNIVMSNTHLYPKTFQGLLDELASRGVTPELRIFDVPFAELPRRNAERAFDDRVPVDFLNQCFTDMHADNAWWRTFLKDPNNV